jgi:hypothetical protein
MLLILLPVTAFAIESAVQGTIEKVDSAAKTVVVKLADGTEQTFHFLGRTAVHGTQAAVAGGKEAFQGLKKGSQVVVHYTAKGAEKTADEVDYVGEGGLQATEGTIEKVDRSAKTLTVKTANGTKETFHLTNDAAHDAGRNISAGAQKASKVTVYYTEESGHKVAHFFKKVF